SEAVTTPAARQVKMEREDDGFEIGKWHGEDSPFSSDNPFQSGSPPLTEDRARSASGEKRRKSAGPGVKDSMKGKSSSAMRRRTDFPAMHAQADDHIHPPSSKTFEIPVSQLKSLPSAKATNGVNGVEAGEEFTPEEQREL